MNTIIKGDNLMLFDDAGKSIGLATSHTLSISGDAVDVSNKDAGLYGQQEVNKINWEITSDNLYSTVAFDALFDKMVARQPVTVYFGVKSESGNGSVDDDGTGTTGQKTWTKPTAGAYTGKVFITSLTANASTGENATFSATFTGSGELKRVTA